MRISDWSSDVCSSDLFACGKLCRPFGPEALAVLLPARDQGVAVPHLAPQHLVGGDDAAHLRLAQRQFVVAERAMGGGRRRIIVQAVGGRGTTGDVGAGKTALPALCQHMRTLVARTCKRVGPLP